MDRSSLSGGCDVEEEEENVSCWCRSRFKVRGGDKGRWCRKEGDFLCKGGETEGVDKRLFLVCRVIIGEEGNGSP